MTIDCGQSIFYFDLVRGVHAHARRKKRGEKRASPVSRLQSRAWSFMRLARFARRTKMKERLPYMGHRIHKMVTYGEKKGKGSAQRRERRTHTLLSLRSWWFSGECCSFLAAEPREDWRLEQVKDRGIFPRGDASRGGSAAKKAPRVQEFCQLRRLHYHSHHSMTFKRQGQANELMRFSSEHHRARGRSSVT